MQKQAIHERYGSTDSTVKMSRRDRDTLQHITEKEAYVAEFATADSLDCDGDWLT
jgi:hypothetical protein